MAVEPRRVNVARRSFTVEYQSGIAEAEAGMSRKSITTLPMSSLASRHDGTNFRSNMVTLAQYDDSHSAQSGRVMGLSTVWACVRLISGTISSLPLMVYERDGESRRVASGHPLYGILHDDPNADQTMLNFWQFMSGALELQGNAYAEIIRAGDGRVIALDEPLVPDFVEPKRRSDGAIEYRVTGKGDGRTIRQENMLHIRGFGGNPLGGLSTLAFGRRVFGLAMGIESAASGTFTNGVRTTGILKTADTLTLEQRQQAEDALQAKFAGAMNAGRPMLLDRGMDWVQLSINPDDAQMLESRSFSVEEICRFFSVPPHMIGHTEKSSSWGTGIEQMTLGFVMFTLRERLKNIESTLEKQLLTRIERKNGMRIEFNIEGLLRADSKGRAEVNEIYLKNKVITINEVRAQDNKPPVAWGDQPWVQMQDIQLDATGSLPIPAPGNLTQAPAA